MKHLNAIDQKIEELKKKKNELESKAALQLYKKLKSTMGEEFSPNLVLGLVTHTWANKTSKMKEAWQESAGNFQRARKSSKAD